MAARCQLCNQKKSPLWPRDGMVVCDDCKGYIPRPKKG